MSFRATATAAAVIALVLGIGYLFAGHLVVGRWQVEPTEGVLLMGRRMGALYVSLAVLFFAARSAEPSPARSAICLGAALALGLLAALGVFEFASGRAAGGILVSAAVETLLAASFARSLRATRQPATA